MEFNMKVQVPAAYFYDTLIRSCMADILAHTKKEVKETELVGYTYTKTFSKHASANVEILKLVKNEIYQYRTFSTKNEITVTYKLQPRDEQSCQLIYLETMEARGGFIQKVNDAVVGVIWTRLKKKKFKNMLRQIEATYQSERS